MKRKVAILLACLFVISGCGYSFYGSGENIDPSIQSVSVGNFINTSNEANIEVLMRNAMIERVIRGGRLTIVASEKDADAVITGNIRSVSIAPLSVMSSSNVAVQARIAVLMDVSFTEKKSGKKIWETASFSKTGDYNIIISSGGSSGGAMLTGNQKQDALKGIATDASDQLYSLMTSGF